MSRAKKPLLHSPESAASTKPFFVRPTAFVFFDRKSGIRRFEVKAGDDGRLPGEQAASLLAIHCVARQQQPRDFDVMVAAGEDLVEGIAGRANKLIRSCSGFKIAGMPLSRRQHEVLAAIAQNLSNKEIAAKLNVAVRTVKFHVSTLLEKFEVRGRVDLMIEAAEFLPLEGVHKRVAASGGSAAVAAAAALLPMAPSASPARLRIAEPAGRRAGD
ncbi:MAG TPA: helix-turn-helix transcriptional regulator [Candidatus Acidoferrum sp.]|nr:helix-turn-helix transcriptional regulator [Candidatus Acidoferrum sp.]